MFYPSTPADAKDALKTLRYCMMQQIREISQISNGFICNRREAPKQIEARRLHAARLADMIRSIRLQFNMKPGE